MSRVIAVGKFDGIHLGHRALLREGRGLSQTLDASFMVFTFPLKRDALIPNEVRYGLLREHADEVEVIPLSEIASLSPDEFLELLVREYGAKAVVMGPGHRFGKGRSGDPDLARGWGKGRGVTVRVLKPLLCQGRPISSRHIREALREGRVREARLSLGRYPALYGTRIEGAKLGRTLGFPTVNLELPGEILRPKEGVYVAYSFWEDGWGKGLLYIGERPTFPDLPPSCEIHLLDPPGRDPGGTIEVQLLEYLRGDIRFPSAEALKEQIEADISRAEAIFEKTLVPRPLHPAFRKRFQNRGTGAL